MKSVDLTKEDYERLRHPLYGRSNPEEIENALWHEMLVRYWHTKDVRAHFGDEIESSEDETEATARPHVKPKSGQREKEDGPVWSFDRTGETLTKLEDNTEIKIGGAHKPFGRQAPDDFCIYNEVLVRRSGTRQKIYGYPKDLFPPTWYHTATLVENAIVVIGGIGYFDLMHPDKIQVFRLDLGTFEITRIETTGADPGALFKHGAIFDGKSKIIVSGGYSQKDLDAEREPNRTMFELDLESGGWRALAEDEGSFLGFGFKEFRETRRPEFGNANPQKVHPPLWEFIVREKLAGYGVRRKFGDWDYEPGRPYPGKSEYRELPIGPTWSWERFGQTATNLPDGRKIYIAGEYEDAYDPDFCIYNDAVVEHPDGRLDFYIYPEDVFPPTDFHSATLVGSDIIIVGSLGYMDKRKPGETHIFKLDTNSFSMERISAKGEAPGWISHHGADYDGKNAILIYGGATIDDEGRLVSNLKQYELLLDSCEWRRVPPGDTRFFAATMDEYQADKFARFGYANPEKIESPFWLAMAARQWSPSRARQHFCDAPEQKEKDREQQRNRSFPQNSAIWSTVRDASAEVDLRDGRTLLIGGEIYNFGDESEDPWTYNDIVVTMPDGNIEIYAYPLETFPLLIGLSALEADGRILIFGRGVPSGPNHQKPMAFELDPGSLEIQLLDVTESTRPALFTGDPTRDNDKIVFIKVKNTAADDDEYTVFNLRSNRWEKL